MKSSLLRLSTAFLVLVICCSLQGVESSDDLKNLFKGLQNKRKVIRIELGKVRTMLANRGVVQSTLDEMHDKLSSIKDFMNEYIAKFSGRDEVEVKTTTAAFNWETYYEDDYDYEEEDQDDAYWQRQMERLALNHLENFVYRLDYVLEKIAAIDANRIFAVHDVINQLTDVESQLKNMHILLIIFIKDNKPTETNPVKNDE